MSHRQPVILNLGCGDTPLVGALNADHRCSQGVEVILDVYALPFQDSSIASIHASHVIEHFRDFADAIGEIYRVLVPGGTLVVSAPYGLEALLNPYHHHAFDESTIKWFSQEFRDLDVQASQWRVRNLYTRREASWYLASYMNILMGKKREIFFTLEAVKE